MATLVTTNASTAAAQVSPARRPRRPSPAPRARRARTPPPSGFLHRWSQRTSVAERAAPCPGRLPGPTREVARSERASRPVGRVARRPSLLPMTTTTLLPADARLRARAAVLVAAVGPLAVAALRGLLPYDTVDDNATIVAKVAAHPGAETAVLWLSVLALITLPLSVLVVNGVAMRARPLLGTVAAVIAWVGFSGLAYLVTQDQVARAGFDAGLPTDATAALMSAIDQSAVASTAAALFVTGHILGVVLLGLALWRVVPRWAALALIVSQPFHFVVAVIVPNHALDALAWVLTAVGFTAAAAVRR